MSERIRPLKTLNAKMQDMADRPPPMTYVSADRKAHPERAGAEFGLLGVEEVPQVTFMSCPGRGLYQTSLITK